MALLTNSWAMDFPLIGLLIFLVCYLSYGTWIFTTLFYSFIFAYLFYQYKFLYWRKYKIPVSTPWFPMGNLWSVFFKAPGDVMKAIYDGGIGHRFTGVWFLFKPAIVLRDPELIKQILVKEFVTFQERGIYVNRKYDPLNGKDPYSDY